MKLSTKQVLLLIAVLTVIAVPVLAQTSAPATAVAAAGDPGMALPDAPTPATNRPPSVSAVGRPTFGGEQVIDKEFVIGNSVMLGSTIANIELTHRCLENDECSLVPRPLVRRRALYGVALPADAGIAVLGYYLKRSGHRWWFVPAAIVTAGNTIYGIHAAQHMR